MFSQKISVKIADQDEMPRSTESGAGRQNVIAADHHSHVGSPTQL
jgi:hypothetical protein